MNEHFSFHACQNKAKLEQNRRIYKPWITSLIVIFINMYMKRKELLSWTYVHVRFTLTVKQSENNSYRPGLWSALAFHRTSVVEENPQCEIHIGRRNSWYPNALWIHRTKKSEKIVWYPQISKIIDEIRCVEGAFGGACRAVWPCTGSLRCLTHPILRHPLPATRRGGWPPHPHPHPASPAYRPAAIPGAVARLLLHMQGRPGWLTTPPVHTRVIQFILSHFSSSVQ